MSNQHAQAALSRMNMSIAFMSPHYGGFVADMRHLADAPVTPEPAMLTRRADDLCSTYGYGPSVREKPFAFRDGTAIIPVHGTLINRYSYSWSFLTGYNFIRAQLAAALDDDDVKLIVFDINSYGGEAAGCFELADEIREARSRKSLLAVVDSNCCSAAYAIASAATRVIVTPSGQAGSIGVIAMHISMEKMLDQWGLEVTIMSSFEHKGDGNPYKKLPENVRNDIAAQVEKRALEFVSLVAKNRNISEDLVRETESRTFRADDALQRKLIDAVQAPSKAVSTFLAELGGEDPCDQEDEDMTDTAAAPKTPAPAAAAPATPAPASLTQADVAQMVADGIAADRARSASILACDEAKGRESLAQHCAEQGMSLEQAKGILAAAPKAADKADGKQPEAGADGKSQFEQRMDTGAHPEVGADADGGTDQAADPSKGGVAFANSVLDMTYGAKKS